MSLFETVKAFFQDDGWNVVQLEGQTRLATRFAGEHGEFHCVATVEEEDQVFIFHVVAHLTADMAALIEFITRANFGLYLGNFEMDLGSDTLRFKSSFDGEGAQVTAPLIRNAVYAACMTMDRHWPALQQLAAGSTVEAALATLDATGR